MQSFNTLKIIEGCLQFTAIGDDCAAIKKQGSIHELQAATVPAETGVKPWYILSMMLHVIQTSA